LLLGPGGKLHNIEQLRRKLGFSQGEAAELCGVSQTTISRIESCRERYKINLRTAQLIEAGLDQRGLFSPSEISHLGRPPQTGHPVIHIHTRAIICPSCAVEASILAAIDGNCELCDGSLGASLTA